MNTDKIKPQEFEFVAEIKQLLDIIINSLYTHPEIFIRELVSNSSDALNKIRLISLTQHNIQSPELELRIDITVDPTTNKFSIEDTGIGMTRDEVIRQIGTIAHSGTSNFLKPFANDQKQLDINLIGRFGVGFYSVFMVTEEVTLETRSYLPDSTAVRWKSSGKEKYIVEEIERERRGTLVYFNLKPEHKEFANPEKVKEIIKRYSNFVGFPIYVNNERVNTIESIWHKKKEELEETEVIEFYKFITNDTNPPLSFFPIQVEGTVNFKALLFIPDSPPKLFWQSFFEKTIHLYSHRVFIQDDNSEILPEYLRFVRGVLDTEDLPLNISRETIQNSPVISKIRQILTSRILNHLEELLTTNPDKYDRFIETFGQILKGGISIDSSNKERIISLLKYQSTTLPKGQYTTLDDYIARMKEGQKSIYYVLANSRDLIERNPNLEYFKRNNLEVLIMTDPIDAFVVPFITEYKDKPLKSIDKADPEIKKDETYEAKKLDPVLANKLFERFKQVLGDKVLNVQESNRLIEFPITLVAPQYGLDPQSEKIFKILDKDFIKTKRILEINTSHPLICNLAEIVDKNSDEKILNDIILQLYEGTLLLDGEIENTLGFVERLNNLIQQLTDFLKYKS
ncbi:MAG: molecular chaperone HtpG [Ignavibacteria bacterium]|nr:molecular chaperone HtpG [Ignavibacteria bacterium]